jgi:hypothetical protein
MNSPPSRLAPQVSGPTEDAVGEFEALYRANVAAVTAYFARRSADPQAVADLTADTFVQAITSFATFGPRRGTPGPGCSASPVGSTPRTGSKTVSSRSARAGP